MINRILLIVIIVLLNAVIWFIAGTTDKIITKQEEINLKIYSLEHKTNELYKWHFFPDFEDDENE